jgi:hypothetical protein
VLHIARQQQTARGELKEHNQSKSTFNFAMQQECVTGIIPLSLSAAKYKKIIITDV